LTAGALASNIAAGKAAAVARDTDDP